MFVKIAIGNGATDTVAERRAAPEVEVLETFPQLIGYDPKVFNYSCGSATWHPGSLR
jgi:hypothetical protein